jgi:hypothetical protein
MKRGNKNLEESYLLGYNAMYRTESQPTFRRNMSPPSSGSKNKPSKNLLATFFMLVTFLTSSSTLNMEATCSSKTLVGFRWTTRRYIKEDRTLHNHRC